LYRSGKASKITKKVRTGGAKARGTRKTKVTKATIMAKIEASIRRKVNTYLAKQKRGMKRSTHNNRTRDRRKTKTQRQREMRI